MDEWASTVSILEVVVLLVDNITIGMGISFEKPFQNY